MSRIFFFQQTDTKIYDFDEGVLILEPLFWGNFDDLGVIIMKKICSIQQGEKR